MKKILAAAALLIATSSVAHADEFTSTKLISNLLFEGATGDRTVYFETPTGHWGAPGCPNAQYVMVRGIEGIKELLAIGLAAKMSERNVRFFGTCNDASYFLAHYIVVE